MLTGRASPPEGGAQARPGSVTARVNGAQFDSLNWMYGVAPDTAAQVPSVRLFGVEGSCSERDAGDGLPAGCESHLENLHEEWAAEVFSPPPCASMGKAATGHPHFLVRHRVCVRGLDVASGPDASGACPDAGRRLETAASAPNAASFTRRESGSTVELAVYTAAR